MRDHHLGRRAGLIALASLLAVQALAQPADHPASWKRRPTPDELLAVYPSKAFTRGEPGKATIACRVSAQGVLHDCAVASESPAGAGFGAAALALVPQLMFNPATRNGVPVDDFIVRIPIDFLPPDAPTGSILRRGGSHGEVLTPVLTDVPWAAAPTYAEVQAAFPEDARAKGRNGRATLSCLFRKDGRLGRCDLVSSDPENAGFDLAARNLVTHFRGPLKLADGRSTDGMSTVIAFNFVAPSADGAPAPMGKPRWTALPSADALGAAYPAAARQAGVATGRAVLDCIVADDGALGHCAVVSQDPDGLGFGDAALALAPSFHASIWTGDGLPTIGGHLRLPLRLNRADEPSAAKP